jgi:hypothetical protein
VEKATINARMTQQHNLDDMDVLMGEFGSRLLTGKCRFSGDLAFSLQRII